MPGHDLAQLWETRTRYEFETWRRARRAEAILQIAFHWGEPPDLRLTPVSRTIAEDRLVDEFIVHFTHTTEIDWMLPGIPPTGRAVSVPTVAVVQFQDGKLVHEHIYWDQATVLVQIGVLDPAGLPVMGAECARKVVDRTVPSNALMQAQWQTSADKPI